MANKQVNKKTKDPSGLSIKRNGYKFECGWKIADKDHDDGQQMHYTIHRSYEGTGDDALMDLFNRAFANYVNANNGDIMDPKTIVWYWSTSIGKRTTTKNVKPYSASQLFPSHIRKLDFVAFQVRGNRDNYTKDNVDYKYGWSDWSIKKYKVSSPKPPTITTTYTSPYTTRFSWSVPDSGKEEKTWFARIQTQTVLTANGAAPQWPNATPSGTGTLTWPNTSGTEYSDNATGSRTFTEQSFNMMSTSKTRWFRARALGPGGASAWVVKSHTYAVPNKAILQSNCKATADRSGGTSVSVVWKTSASKSRPIDSATVQYAIATPEENLSIPDGHSSWTDFKTGIKDTKNNAVMSGIIDGAPAEDQCLWVRVNTLHDTNTNYSVPKLLKVGTLNDPINIRVVDLDTTTKRVTIHAENESSVPDSFLRVRFKQVESKGRTTEVVIGTIPHGETEGTFSLTKWWTVGKTISFSVQAEASNGTYTMKSSKVNLDGNVPLAPTITASTTSNLGTIRVTWNTRWTAADGTELSWADHEDAWESTDEPSTYVVSNVHSNAWNITGLTAGTTWYVRARSMLGNGDEATYGLYSTIASVDLTTAPTTPTLSVSNTTIPVTGSVLAAWGYYSEDGTPQSDAQIAEVTIQNDTYRYRSLRGVGIISGAQHVSIVPAEVGWNAGETHMIAVRVKSSNGKFSNDWSNVVSVSVAELITCSISSTSLVTEEIIDPDADVEDEDRIRNVLSFKAFPLRMTVLGAGVNGTTTVSIERAEAYPIVRPDGSRTDGFENETIVSVVQTGENEIVIEKDHPNLVGSFDDGALYRILATTSDEYGQTAEDEISAFEVHWTNQALMPEADVTFDENTQSVLLTPQTPDNTREGDTCDIYRLSTDGSTLIYSGAEFGTTYMDPYPTIGENGGYRFVYITKDGDYITEDDRLAWYETGGIMDSLYNFIDFGSGRVELIYNVDLSHTWKKDFKETQYLGGSVQGDWNPAVSKTGSINGVVITAEDQEMIATMRELANYPGVCHVRTVDGSNYTADVQVSESRGHEPSDLTVSFTLSFTRVDPPYLDAVVYEEPQPEEQEG